MGEAQSTSITEASRQVIARYWRIAEDAADRGGLSDEEAEARIRRFLHEDVVYEVMGSTPVSGVHDGLDTVIRDVLQTTKPRLSEYTSEVEQIIAEGDTVVVRSKNTGAIGPTGLPYDNRYCFIYTVRDGKIAKVVEYMDTQLTHTALFGQQDACAGGHTCLVDFAASS